MAAPQPIKPSGKHNRRISNAQSHRTSASTHKIEIRVNVYDLLPPGRISSIFWTLGVGLLHTGVVINDKEYAFGGHDRRGVTGVYWTKSGQEPPGGTFRTEFLQGFTFMTPTEIEQVLRETTEEFLGTSYNVLTRNCNHFTSYFCEKLTGRSAPAWINRAASIGVALPCVVPQAWVSPPECEEEAMLVPEDVAHRRRNDDEHSGDEWSSDEESYSDEEDSGKGRGRSKKTQDEAGRPLPQSERADLRTVL